MKKTRFLKKRLRSVENALRAAAGRPRRMYNSHIDFVIRKGNGLQFACSDGHQSRQEASMHILIEALKTIKYEARRDRRLSLYTTDCAPDEPARPVMSYSTVRGSKNIIPVPDFIFWNWPDVGIADYEELRREMIEAGADDPADDRLFWIGNAATNPIRDRLIEIAAQDRRIHAVDVTWIKQGRPEAWASDGSMQTQEANYVSLPDHCRYKYLIDVEGIGYSARLKVLLFSGRPVFLQERPWREFFFDEIEPFRHYIPVARDLSDLTEKLDWAEAHPLECRQIAREARAYAEAHLTREAAVLRMRETISQLLA